MCKLEEKENIDFIICPICGEKHGNLNMHVFYKHNLTAKEFRVKYPNTRMQIPTKGNLVKSVCPVCGKVYKSKSALGTHISHAYPDLKNNIKKTDYKEGYICPICGTKTINIAQHVNLTHELSWKNFVKQYNWTGMKKYVSEETHKKLSINKKKFYNSEKGKVLKEIQSKGMSGKNNIIYLPGVKEKVLKTLQQKDKPTESCGYGISIRLADGIRLRSFAEFCIYALLKENNIDFEYENIKIRYEYKNNIHTYHSDFKINDTLYELKMFSTYKIENNKYKDYERYKIIKETIEKEGFIFKLVNPVMLLTDFNIHFSFSRIMTKQMTDKLYDYCKANKVLDILLNKGKSKNFNTFLEKEERWKEFDFIRITHA